MTSIDVEELLTQLLHYLEPFFSSQEGFYVEGDGAETDSVESEDEENSLGDVRARKADKQDSDSTTTGELGCR